MFSAGAARCPVDANVKRTIEQQQRVAFLGVGESETWCVTGPIFSIHFSPVGNIWVHDHQPLKPTPSWS
jgi:hypothetical protein